jgi:hypothetical protein
MIQKLFRYFRQRRLQIVNLPESYGPLMSVAELRAVLADGPSNPAVRAVVQLLHYQRAKCVSTALDSAYREKPPAFDLGGAHALEELHGELHQLSTAGEVSATLEAWFRTEKAA